MVFDYYALATVRQQTGFGKKACTEKKMSVCKYFVVVVVVWTQGKCKSHWTDFVKTFTKII